MDFIRFLKIRSHFRQEFVGRNADVYRKTKAAVDFVLDVFCSSVRGCVAMGDPGKIQETFIDTDLFNIRSQAVQKVHHAVAVLMIKVMVRRCRHKIRAFS